MKGAGDIAPDPSVQRIIVRAPNWLGDLVMSTPGFRAIRAAYPAAEIVAVLPVHLRPLLEGSPDFDALWPLEPGRGAAFRRMQRQIRAERFDLGIVIPESVSSALLFRLGGVRRVMGFARDPLRRALLHDEVPAPSNWERRRWVAKEAFVLRLMSAAGAHTENDDLGLPVLDADVARLAETLARHGVDADDLAARRPIVIAPGAAFGPSKCWPVASYAGLVDALGPAGAPILLVGTAEERARTRAVMEGSNRVGVGSVTIPGRVDTPDGGFVVDLAGELDLGALKALLRCASLLVANDAGTRHIAAALGVPSVIFFGPTSTRKTPAHLDRVEVLETAHACRPCYRRTCPIDHRCLTSISVSEAVAAADRARSAGVSASAFRHRATAP